jgi:hypothetical protein
MQQTQRALVLVGAMIAIGVVLFLASQSLVNADTVSTLIAVVVFIVWIVFRIGKVGRGAQRSMPAPDVTRQIIQEVAKMGQAAPQAGQAAPQAGQSPAAMPPALPPNAAAAQARARRAVVLISVAVAALTLAGVLLPLLFEADGGKPSADFSLPDITIPTEGLELPLIGAGVGVVVVVVAFILARRGDVDLTSRGRTTSWTDLASRNQNKLSGWSTIWEQPAEESKDDTSFK